MRPHGALSQAAKTRRPSISGSPLARPRAIANGRTNDDEVRFAIQDFAPACLLPEGWDAGAQLAGTSLAISASEGLIVLGPSAGWKA